jgi:hypothetical protein
MTFGGHSCNSKNYRVIVALPWLKRGNHRAFPVGCEYKIRTAVDL